MKNRVIILSAVAALLLGACTPVVYNVPVQVRQRSTSGVNLIGKTISIVSLRSEDASDTLFTRTLAETLASDIEKDLFGSEQAVGTYDMIAVPGADYGSKDSLVSVIMQTGSDVVILQDCPKLVMQQDGGVKLLSNLYLYDSMDKNDRVRAFVYGETLADEMEKVAAHVGAEVASRILPVWKTTTLRLYFYEEADDWEKALDHVDKGEWNKAMEIWMKHTSQGNALFRAAACYNIAASCYVLGDCDLALKWLDASSELAELEYAPELRKKIINLKSNQ